MRPLELALAYALPSRWGWIFGVACALAFFAGLIFIGRARAADVAANSPEVRGVGTMPLRGPFAQVWYPLAFSSGSGGDPVADTDRGWPVILYTPGWGGDRFQNRSLCEALVRAGFVVFAIEPTGGNLPPLDFSTAESTARFEKAANEQLDLQATALLGAFAKLADANTGKTFDGLFAKKLDLSAVGVLGYSFGGAVAAEALRREPSLRAGANLDGTLFGQAALKGASQPFLFLTDTEAMPGEAQLHSSDGATRRSAEFAARGLNDMDRWLREHGGWLIQLRDAGHGDFCDPRKGGPRGPSAGIERYVTAFFKQTLRGEPQPILAADGPPLAGFQLRHFPAP